jgi:cytochrome o ubiquinol oxidase subunit 2
MNVFTCRTLFALSAFSLLAGCDAVVLNPSGDVAAQERTLLLFATGLMLLIILPVMALTVLFCWRYRQTNTTARFEPDWDHSTQLELVIWAAPLLIIIVLGAATWMATHILDPYRPLGRLGVHRPLVAGTEPLQVQVVALDWKWLFIYPQLGIATVNDVAAPLNRPINFQITSGSVMNSFYIPALAGQVYAMPGMQTTLQAVINKAGDFEGFSANYSGAGFSGMRFRFHGLSDSDFAQWVSRIKEGGGTLDRRTYLDLEHPTENNPVQTFSDVTPALFHAAVNLCVEPAKMCMDEMMRIDAHGGLGLAGAFTVVPLTYDKFARRGGEAAFVESLCKPAWEMPAALSPPNATLANATPVAVASAVQDGR